MRRLIIAVFAFIAVALPALASGPESQILVLRAPDAPGKVTVERIATCVRLIAQELKVSAQDLPRIVVMHVSQRGAAAAGIDRTLVRRNFDAASDHVLYYEFWVVGEPRDVDYSAAVMNILENRIGQKLEQKDRLAIMHRAVRYLQSTVSAYGE